MDTHTPFALTIHDLDPAVESRLRDRAARNGRSIEAEVRAILVAAIGPAADAQPEAACDDVDLATFIRSIVEPIGGFTLELPSREKYRPPPFWLERIAEDTDES